MEEPQYHLQGVVHSRAEEVEDFNGPLDVILQLLSKNKIAIQDISITSILEQYLAYLEEMKRLDMEIASEFIAMASYLMLIKTKMLLSVSEQQEALSEMEQLIRSLESRQRQDAYRQIQIAVETLASRNDIGRGLFTKQPEPITPDGTYTYQHEKADLLDALRLISERQERNLPPPRSSFQGIVEVEPYPLALKTKEILKRLLSRGVSRFLSLFQGNRSRSEVVATFLAVLELCRLKAVQIEGDDKGEQLVTYLGEPEAQTLQEAVAETR